jgi:hypothetical protein
MQFVHRKHNTYEIAEKSGKQQFEGYMAINANTTL